MTCRWPVSYTHLDVYKRQDHKSNQSDLEYVLQEKAHDLHVKDIAYYQKSDKQKQSERQLRGAALDVYKRQRVC